MHIAIYYEIIMREYKMFNYFNILINEDKYR